ncbi:phage portal protein [Buttiauxella sp. 3AFRM03]|uniref:phage portal protein n=1 Tax=Buttiauxella sp. 3AFRM03 TaxID=2479367 RepID=UPI000EF7BF46|nr:phage portal protein [Buttiauxella sp. 3AFRM03]AYN29998.1 phage portal protein [Buttiauxella sp. 3AFRM03]
MGVLGRMLASVSPGWAARRAKARMQLQAYEAAKPTRTHAAKREGRTANSAVSGGAASLREQARWLDENHDLAAGILDKIEDRVVGADGIQIEPHPLRADGSVHEEFAVMLAARFAEWALSPDVTGLHTFAEAQRMMLRTAMRDGEVFVSLVQGNAPGLIHRTPEKLAFEMLEPDLIPMNFSTFGNEGAQTVQGVDVNSWGRPIAYHVLKVHPSSVVVGSGAMKKVPARNMLHLAFRKRIHQLRGVSFFAPALIRIADLKEYEQSERISARIAASLGFYIKRGDASTFDSDGDWNGEEAKDREFEMSSGQIYDRLAPGEDLVMLESNRPNTHLAEFRNGQLKAVAAGTRTGYSSISRDYNGSYSAQRQELIESMEGYAILQNWFTSHIIRPLYRTWVDMFPRNEIPSDVIPASLYNAIYLGPVMPWIDPVKENEAWKIQIRGGAASEAEWARARGRNPDAVKRQRQREIKYNQEHGLIYDTDPANDNPSAGGGSVNSSPGKPEDGKSK